MSYAAKPMLDRLPEDTLGATNYFLELYRRSNHGHTKNFNSKIPTIIPFYRYLYLVKRAILRNEPLPFYEIFQEGGRHAGKSMSVNILIRDLYLIQKNVQIISIVDTVNKVNDSIFKDIYGLVADAKPDFGKRECNLTQKTIGNPLSSPTYVQCMGVFKTGTNEKVPLKGFHQVDRDYLIVHFEESNQIPLEVKDAIQMAVRSYKVPYDHIIFIHSCNPENINNPSTVKVLKEFPESETELREKGFQLLAKPDERTLYTRTNYRINPMLEEFIINKIEAMRDYNYPQWRVWSLGLAGTGSGAVFADYLPNLVPYHESFPNLSEEIVGGMDFGYVKDATALVLCGRDEEGNVVVFFEYYFENSKKTKFNVIQNAQAFILAIKQQALRHRILTEPFTIYCDTADYAYMSVCEEVANQMGMGHISFVPTKKIPLDIRIGLLLKLINTNSLSIRGSCFNLIREISIAKYDEKSTTVLKLQGKNDHCLDAFFYGIQIWLEGNKLNDGVWQRVLN